VAVVGDAYIVVRAITNRVRDDIQKELNGVSGDADRAGNDVGNSFSRGFQRATSRGLFDSKFAREAETARKTLNRLIQTGFFLGPAISGLVGAVGSLGAGLATLTTIAGAAAPSLIALGGAFAALIQGAGVLRLAFGGVGNAISAGSRATGGAANNTRQLEAAQKRLLESKKALDEFYEEADQRRIEATRRSQDAQDNLADAIIGAERTERSYFRAQKAARDALEDVTKAREEAREAIQQLRFELEGGAISEKKARLEFEKARDALQRVQDLPPNSRARQEAELAFAEAELNLRKAIDRNSDLKKEEAAATKAGVEGSKRVQDAIYARAEALQAEEDASVDLARTNRDLAKTRQDTAAAEEFAAPGGGLDKQLQKEEQALKDAIKEAKKDLKDLEDGAGGGPNAFQQALAKLSPEAQEFVKFILNEFKPAVDELRDAAGKEFFPKLITALTTIKDDLFPTLKPLIQETGSVLGDIAIDIANVVTETDNLDRLQRVWKTNDGLLKNLGKAAGNLYTLFLILLDAAEPVIKQFGEWVERLTGTWASDAEKNFEGLRSTFEKSGEVASRIGGLFRDYIEGFKNIGKAITTPVEDGVSAFELLLGYFEKGAEKFREFTEAGLKDGSLAQYFFDATENATKVLDLIVNIVAEILKLGDDEGVGTFVGKLSEAVDIFGEVGADLNNAAPALGDFVVKFAELTRNLTGSGAINNFFAVLNTALDIVNKIFGNETVKKVFAFTSGVFAVVRGFGLLLSVGKFLGKALIGNFLKLGSIFSGFSRKDPFGMLRNSSGLTRAELKKQMIVDKQKEFAMKGIYLSSQQASLGLGKVTKASNITKGSLAAGATTAQVTATKMSLLGKAKTTLGNGFKAVGTGLKGFGAGIKAALGPIGLIFLAIELLIPLIVKLWQENETFRNVVMNVVNAVKGAFESIINVVMVVWEAIKPIFETIGNAVKTYIIAYVEALKIAWDLIMTAVQAVWDFLKPIFELIGNAVKTYITFYVDALKLAWDLISTAVQAVWDFIRPIFEKIGEGIKNSITKFVDLLKTAWDGIKTAVSAVWDFIKPIFGFIGNGIKNSITFYVNALKTAWDAIKTTVNTVWNFVKPIFEKIGDGIRDGIGGAVDFVSGLFDGLKSTVKTIFNAIAGFWNSTFGKLSFKVPGWVPGIGGNGFDVPDIPTLAKGGVIPASLGGTLALLAEAGRPERVEPLDPDGLSRRDKAMIDYMSGGMRGGVTVNVYPSPGMDERELAQKVSRELAYMMKRGAA
jgi:phage-related protein